MGATVGDQLDPYGVGDGLLGLGTGSASAEFLYPIKFFGVYRDGAGSTVCGEGDIAYFVQCENGVEIAAEGVAPLGVAGYGIVAEGLYSLRTRVAGHMIVVELCPRFLHFQGV